MNSVKAGLIRFASADTFSGESMYLLQYTTSAFDSTFINYNPTDQAMEDQVIPDAHTRGMAVLTRECFRKGLWFTLAEKAGIKDSALAARCAIKWSLRDTRITAVVLGVSNPEQLKSHCAAIESPELTPDEEAALSAICALDRFKDALRQRRKKFKQ